MVSRRLIERGASRSLCANMPYRLCSNRAATRANLLKSREKRHGLNVLICRYFASSRNLQQTIALPSHGRGRWFETSIAHSEKRRSARVFGRRQTRTILSLDIARGRSADQRIAMTFRSKPERVARYLFSIE